MWNSKVILRPGETLRLDKSSSHGFMSEEDINEHSIIDAEGKIVGRVVHTDHTAVKGFRRTQTVIQTDEKGKVSVDEQWSGS